MKQEMKICSNCKKEKRIAFFISLDGKECSTCSHCRHYKDQSRIRNNSTLEKETLKEITPSENEINQLNDALALLSQDQLMRLHADAFKHKGYFIRVHKYYFPADVVERLTSEIIKKFKKK